MARQFTRASSHYIRTPSAVPAAIPFTMACWFKVPDVNTEYNLMARASTGNSRHAMRVRGDVAGDPVQFIASDATTSAELNTTTGVTANVWQHAAVVCASATSRAVFLNGGGKATSVNSYSPTTTSLWIGAVNQAGAPVQFFEGGIAEAAVWDVALTDEEVATLAKGVSPLFVRQGSMAFYAPLIRDVNEILYGTTLTDSGTAAFNDHPRIYSLS